MLVLSHRGVHRDCEENTLSAFEAAVRMGVDGVETDLRATSDGRIVLYHDRRLPSGEAIADLTYAEMGRLLGRDPATLEEATAAFPDLYWNLEIKDYRRIDVLTRAIRAAASRSRVLATSFWHPAAAALAAEAGVECGALVGDRPLEPEGFLAGLAVAGVRALVWSFEWMDGDLVRVAAERGFRNFVYDVESYEEHRAAARLPLEGVITDWPERAVRSSPES
jgi:glycerophosphoryl diester phosphodiesterase